MWIARLRTEAAFQLLAWGTGFLSSILKAVMKRPRPVAGSDLRVVAAPLGGSSFPSGHVITYVGTYGFLAYLVHTRLRARAGRRPIVAGLLAMIGLVGPSRIHQGHHWPTDVTASYLLGTSYLLGLIALYRRVKELTGAASGGHRNGRGDVDGRRVDDRAHP
jgi:undecaprenyl-diphosphatase